LASVRREVLQGERAGYGEQIVSTLSRQLAWSHFLELIYLKDPLARDFYAEMCRIERTALSKKPDELIRLELDALHSQGDMTPPLLLKDPYVLDFLGLQGPVSGKRPGRRHPARP